MRPGVSASSAPEPLTSTRSQIETEVDGPPRRDRSTLGEGQGEGESQALYRLHQRLHDKRIVTSLRKDRTGRQWLRLSPHFYVEQPALHRMAELLQKDPIRGEPPNPSAYGALHLWVQRDDGIAVHLNGNRVLLDNLDSRVGLGDFALTEVPDAERLKWHHYLIDRTKLIAGRNLLAVEVHQASITDTDLVFDLQLTGTLNSGGPRLFVRKVNDQIELSWSAAYNQWVLGAADDLAGANWAPVAAPVLLDAGWHYVTVPVGMGNWFFRLARPQ